MKHTESILSADIGGSHIACALVQEGATRLLEDSYRKQAVDAQGSPDEIINAWAEGLRSAMTITPQAIGIAIPGPFDYEAGISYMKGQGKYESLYKLDVRGLLQSALQTDIPVFFENDAACFGLGQTVSEAGATMGRVLAVTLGTGIGSAFVEKQEPLTVGQGVPPDGYLYNAPYLDGIAEDYISGRWLLRSYRSKTKANCREVKEIAQLAQQGDEQGLSVFTEFGGHIGRFLTPWVKRFEPAMLVLGGSIAKSAALFLPHVQRVFSEAHIDIPVTINTATERSAIMGAAIMANKKLQRMHA